MRKYTNLRLIWKVLAAPIIVILLLIGVAGFGMRGLVQAENNFQGLDEGIVQPLADALSLKDGLSLFHARLLALLTAAANDRVVANTREASINKLEADLKTIEQNAVEQSALWKRHVGDAAVANVQGALHDYAEAARGVGEAAKADISYGVLMLTDANARFETLRTRLDAIAHSLQQRRSELTAQTEALSAASRNRLAILASIAALLGLVVAIWNARLIARPVVALTGVMGRLASHDMSAEVAGLDRGDELGAMARAVQVFKTSMLEEARLAAKAQAERGTRERRQSAMDRHTQDFGTSISGVMASLARSANGMRSAASTMADAANEVRQQAASTVTRAAQASGDLTAVAAAVEQLTGNVEEVSRQVAITADVAREAVQRAETGRGSMQELADATARIGNVVRLISEIAAQTNLLALNATIEAARAGEAGKGFAVVANEVKALAAQTTKATAEIGGHIAAIRTATEQSISAMSEVGKTISKMDQVAASVAASIEQQSATTRQIAGNVHAVSEATDQTTHAMENVAGVAENAGAVSDKVSDAAANIAGEAETLRTEVDQFLTAVRDDTGERRRYERLPGNGTVAIIRADNRPATKSVVVDMSRGGVALECDWQLAAGSEMELDLPGAPGTVTARVVRSADNVLAVVFKQDTATLALVDKAYAMLDAGRSAA